MIQLESCSYRPLRNDQFELSIKSLSIAKGARVFIVGPSGSGKTTLLKALAGLLPGCTGRLSIDGERVNSAEFPLHRKGIMFLSQELGLWSHLTGKEQVSFVVTRGKSLNSQESLYWLELVGLEHKQDSRPNRLSGGEQKRLALARALAAEPRHLFLDEPFANIDPVLADELMNKIDKEQCKRKFSLIKVTHHCFGIKNDAVTLLVIYQGRVVQQGTLTEIAKNPVNDWTKKWVHLIEQKG